MLIKSTAKKLSARVALAFAALSAGTAHATMVKLDFIGTLYEGTPFAYSLTYDTTLDTDTTYYGVGALTPSGVAGEPIYGYSKSGIVELNMTFGGVAFTKSDISPRFLDIANSSDFYLNADITSEAPTGMSLDFSSAEAYMGFGGMYALADGSLAFSNAFSAYRGRVYGNGTFSIQRSVITAVPEPETYAMLLAGLGLLGVVARRRKTRA